MQDYIYVKGARQHNLKNISLKIPRNKLVAFTGVSGSGKSSLVFNTIYAEGRRRLMELLTAYERTGMSKTNEADVDFIEGLSPTIVIEQKTISRNSRSTVGTLTDIYSLIRLLFSRTSKAICPYCKKEVSTYSRKEITDCTLKYPYGTLLEIYSPILSTYPQNSFLLFQEIREYGYTEVYWNKKLVTVDKAEELYSQSLILRENQSLHKNGYSSNSNEFINEVSDNFILQSDLMEVMIGKIIVSPQQRKKIQILIEEGLKVGNGLIRIVPMGQDINNIHSHFSCEACGLIISKASASAFSFNTPLGACTTCTGLGRYYYVDPDLIIPDKSKSLADGAIELIGWKCEKEKFHKNRKIFEGLAKRYSFDLNTPVKDLPSEALYAVLYGTKGEKIKIENPSVGGKPMYEKFPGIVNIIYDRFNSYAKNEMSAVKGEDGKVMRECRCPSCLGTRLKPERLLHRMTDKTIHDISIMPIDELKRFCEEILDSGSVDLQNDAAIIQPILRDVITRLTLLIDVGLGYLCINRPVTTLSGGESQRIRLTTQLGSGLIGMIYIMDEPSLGLHSKDCSNMMRILYMLRNLGNSVFVVEHDYEIISKADYIIDIGPGAGVLGGEIVAEGTVDEVKQNPRSLTGQYLAGKKIIPIPHRRICIEKSIYNSYETSNISCFGRFSNKYLEIIGAREKNLKNINVRIPLGCFVGITGVSGAGKSTLVNDVIYGKMISLLNGRPAKLEYDVIIKGVEWISDVVYIDQLPIGRTSRSNPATYVGIFDDIRKIFSETQKAKQMKFKESHFSFNSPGGQCEVCAGLGVIVTEMYFMPDVEVVCEACQGKRYNNSVLEITYKEKNIADVLNMSIEEATAFFSDQPDIYEKLALMTRLGIGYMKLGQPSTTLSGGEAQRIKLVEELSDVRKRCNKLYILDEPTTGMHLDDIQKLLTILQDLVNQGNTVLVIEHNIQLIKTLDYIIDLGPEGGAGGGRIVASGTPEEVAVTKGSYTGWFLYKALFKNNEVQG